MPGSWVRLCMAYRATSAGVVGHCLTEEENKNLWLKVCSRKRHACVAVMRQKSWA